MYYGAIEAGGTKMNCAICNEKGEILQTVRIPTENPKETMEKIVGFYEDYSLAALGVGSFGPINLQRGTPDYGRILHTPKVKWEGFSIYEYLVEHLGCRVVVDTDVNAAALAEYLYGALQGVDNCMYVTVGTGIGVGIILNGQLHHGMLHPEAGHILIGKNSKDLVKCFCPFHESCLEGLAAGPAIEARAGRPGSELSQEDPIWDLESDYLAQALVNYTLILGVERIVLGGGVMEQKHLFPKIRAAYRKRMGGYMDTSQLRNLDTYIVPPALGGMQGIKGALALVLPK